MLPLAAWLALTWRRELADARLLAKAAAAFAAGLLVYLYLPLSRVSIYGWGELRSLHGFFAHLLRSDYGTLRLSAGQGADLIALARGGSPSIILFRLGNPRLSQVKDRLASVSATSEADLSRGAVVVVERSRHRVHHLPIGSD